MIKAEWLRQKSEVRSQKAEVRRQKSEGRSQKAEVRIINFQFPILHS
ncbi:MULTISPECIES: hypothetical protein [unclassified Moorena]|nr:MULTISPECIES: hypothetical protein [unclassified Moorena]